MWVGVRERFKQFDQNTIITELSATTVWVSS